MFITKTDPGLSWDTEKWNGMNFYWANYLKNLVENLEDLKTKTRESTTLYATRTMTLRYFRILYEENINTMNEYRGSKRLNYFFNSLIRSKRKSS